MRLFVGLRPSEPVLAELAAFLPRLGIDEHATAIDTWHLTLAFIGELDEPRLPDVVEALTEATRGGSPPRLRLAGATVLGRSSTALCVGADGDLTELHELVTEVRSGLKRFAVPFDDRPFKPHLTVARAKDAAGRRLADLAPGLAEFAGEPWDAAEVILYRSRRGAAVSYDVVETFPLA